MLVYSQDQADSKETTAMDFSTPPANRREAWDRGLQLLQLHDDAAQAAAGGRGGGGYRDPHANQEAARLALFLSELIADWHFENTYLTAGWRRRQELGSGYPFEDAATLDEGGAVKVHHFKICICDG